MTLDPPPRWLPRTAAAEALALWAICFVAILVTYPVSLNVAGLVGTAGFLYGPQLAMRARGEDVEHAGLSLHGWRRDLRWFVIASVIVFPLFIGGFVGFAWVFPRLPEGVLKIVTPYMHPPHFAFRVPERFPEWVVQHLFVVAVPEEFFYRGYLQTRLRDAWPDGRLFFGVRLGRAFWVTALLFALGHLAIFQVWRLGVFFPALIFGWLREKTGSIGAAALFHASANILMNVLEASFFG